MVVLFVLCLGVLFLIFVLLAHVCYHILTEWPPIGKVAAHSAYDMFSLYKYLSECQFSLFPPRFLEWESFFFFFLFAPFLDICLLVPFSFSISY